MSRRSERFAVGAERNARDASVTIYFFQLASTLNVPKEDPAVVIRSGRKQSSIRAKSNSPDPAPVPLQRLFAPYELQRPIV